jgi:hypothetical protein
MTKIINNIHIKNVNGDDKRRKKNKKRNLRRKKQKQIYINSHKNDPYNSNASTTQINSAFTGGGIINKQEYSLIPYGGFKSANDMNTTELTKDLNNKYERLNNGLINYIADNEDRLNDHESLTRQHNDNIKQIKDEFEIKANDYIEDNHKINKYNNDRFNILFNKVNDIHNDKLTNSLKGLNQDFATIPNSFFLESDETNNNISRFQNDDNLNDFDYNVYDNNKNETPIKDNILSPILENKSNFIDKNPLYAKDPITILRHIPDINEEKDDIIDNQDLEKLKNGSYISHLNKAQLTYALKKNNVKVSIETTNGELKKMLKKVNNNQAFFKLT